LPVCGRGERALCGEDCRKEFDSKYHACVDTCLAKVCVQPTPTPKALANQDVGAPCVEIESPICDDDCRIETSSRQPRCRRDCLQKACPDASQAEIVNESLDPGSYRCDRCRKRYQQSCNRQCSFGGYATFPYGGLEQYGCEKACIMTSCSKSCRGLSAF
jgi:hypothetical protein